MKMDRFIKEHHKITKRCLKLYENDTPLKSVLDMREELILRGKDRTYKYDPANLNYAHIGCNFYEWYFGVTTQPWRQRFNGKKRDPITGKPTNFLEFDGKVHPTLLFLSIFPKSMERALHFSLETRPKHRTKNGSVAYYDDFVTQGKISSEFRTMEEEMEDFYLELMNPVWFNLRILKEAHCGALLTKRQATDWQKRNYAKENGTYFWLHNYPEEEEESNNVFFACSYMTEEPYLKLHKCLEYIPNNSKLYKDLSDGKHH